MSMGSTGRAFVPSGADGRHIPERDDDLVTTGSAREFVADYEEDVPYRWASISVLGVIVVAATLLVRVGLDFSGSSASVVSYFADDLLFGGIALIIVGCLIALAVFPPAIPWVALAGGLLVVLSFAFFTLPASEAPFAADGLLAVGVVAAILGGYRAIVTWRAMVREDSEPSPSSAA
jgi:hypothetical protein